MSSSSSSPASSSSASLVRSPAMLPSIEAHLRALGSTSLQQSHHHHQQQQQLQQQQQQQQQHLGSVGNLHLLASSSPSPASPPATLPTSPSFSPSSTSSSSSPRSSSVSLLHMQQPQQQQHQHQQQSQRRRIVSLPPLSVPPLCSLPKFTKFSGVQSPCRLPVMPYAPVYNTPAVPSPSTIANPSFDSLPTLDAHNSVPLRRSPEIWRLRQIELDNLINYHLAVQRKCQQQQQHAMMAAATAAPFPSPSLLPQRVGQAAFKAKDRVQSLMTSK
jgi:hypothetical protein